MSQSAAQSNLSPPTLFQLHALTGSSMRLGVVENVGRGNDSRARVKQDPDQHSARILRVDGAAGVPAPLTSTFASTERRLSRLTDFDGESSRVESKSPESKPPESNPDWLADHAGDLIERLRQWSMRLDRRESELDSRERDLNQRVRLLRQHGCES